MHIKDIITHPITNHEAFVLLRFFHDMYEEIFFINQCQFNCYIKMKEVMETMHYAKLLPKPILMNETENLMEFIQDIAENISITYDDQINDYVKNLEKQHIKERATEEKIPINELEEWDADFDDEIPF